MYVFKRVSLRLFLFLLLILLSLPAFAEPLPQHTHVEGYTAPVRTRIVLADAAGENTKDFSYTSAYAEGLSARVLFSFSAPEPLGDEDWNAVGHMLEDLLARATTDVSDTDGMAKSLLAAYEALTQKPSCTLTLLEVTAPYYEESTRGSRSAAVTKLQERLILLGYLAGEADGQYGKITAAAVEAVKKDLYTPPQPAEGKEPAGTPAPPTSPIDGIADLPLLIRLYSDEFPLIPRTLGKGSDKAAVTRLQNRLDALGCLPGNIDGDYGADTRRGVTIFQYYNGLEENGIADEATQRVLFSETAKSPDRPLMKKGDAGDTVWELQQRLILLGFMKGSPDGDYGNATHTAVKELQAYVQEIGVVKTPSSVTTAPPDIGEDEAEGSTAPAGDDTISQNGIADPILLDDFFGPGFPAVPAPKRHGDAGPDVKRIQRRLQSLEYLFVPPDGSYGNGTEEAVRTFQQRNGLSSDGVAGSETLSLLFSGNARPALKPYVLKVSTKDQRVYAYAPDAEENYTRLVRTMKCSTGAKSTPTPKGTYQASTGPGARWHYFKDFHCWAQYAFYIQGDIMFHSVLYGSRGGRVTSSSVRNLGRRASHGCVRLSVADAKWVYTNCPMHTKIIVY